MNIKERAYQIASVNMKNGFPDFPVDGALCRAANDRMKG